MIKLLNKVDNRNSLLLTLVLFLAIFSSFAEVFSISLLIPIANILTGEKIKILNIDFEVISELNLINFDFEILILLIFILFFILRSIILYLSLKFQISVIKKIKLKLKDKLFKILLSKNELSPSITSSDAINILKMDIDIFSNSISSILSLISSLTIVTLLFIGSFLLNPKMFLLASITLFTFFSCYMLLTKTTVSQISIDRRVYNTRAILLINKIWNLFPELKVKNKILIGLKSFIYNENIYEDVNNKKTLLNVAPKLILETLLVFAICNLLLFSFFFEIENSFSTIILYTVVSLKLFPTSSLLFSEIQKLKLNKKSYEVIKKLIYNSKKDISLDYKYFKNVSSIELQNFSYEYEKLKIFNNTNFSIKKGEKVCIIGENGSGKSTLFKILTGITNPSNGSLSVNNTNIELSSRWSGNIGYVPQKPYFFKGSILENINLFEKKQNSKKITNLAKFFNLQYHLKKNALSLKSEVQENAANFSGGQSKRIAFIRSLIKKPDILILDEALDSIDEKDQTSIIRKLTNMKIAIVLITHNAHLEKYFQKIYKIKKKKLALIKQKG